MKPTALRPQQQAPQRLIDCTIDDIVDRVVDRIAELLAAQPALPVMVSIADFAALIDVSDAHVRRKLIPNGLPYAMAGDCVRIPREDGIAWLRAQQKAGDL